MSGLPREASGDPLRPVFGLRANPYQDVRRFGPLLWEAPGLDTAMPTPDHQLPMRVVYYDHAAADRAQPGFRSGDAGGVRITPEGDVETDARVPIPPNSLHALEGHGVVAALNRLPWLTGPIEPARDAVLRPSALDAALHILHRADRQTYGAAYEFVVAECHALRVQYRIAIDNREYQRTLARLQYLVTLASREGFAVRLRL